VKNAASCKNTENNNAICGTGDRLDEFTVEECRGSHLVHPVDRWGSAHVAEIDLGVALQRIRLVQVVLTDSQLYLR
jgi:hypothetical protein